jgi:hypothetical protein
MKSKGQIGLEDLIAFAVAIPLFLALYPIMSGVITTATSVDSGTGSLLALIPAAMVVWLIIIAGKKALGMQSNEQNTRF